MKAVVIAAFGGPDGLMVRDLPDPQPGPGEVLVSIEAIGVGFQDVMIRSGALAGMGFEPGHVLGGEIAGRVAAIGAGVDPGWIGRRVWAFTGLGGGYAERAVVSEAELIALPDSLSANDAVSIGSSGMVAHFALRHAHFGQGESLLIRGAAGPIGIMLVQLALKRGAGVVAVTTSSPERGQRLRTLGATHVLDRTGRGGEDTPDDFDVIIDIVAGPAMPTFLARLKPNGRMVMVGAVGGFPPDDFGKALLPAFRKSLSVATFSADSVAPGERRQVTEDLFAAVGRGELATIVHGVLPLDQAALAHTMLEASEPFGRLLLAPVPQDSAQ